MSTDIFILKFNKSISILINHQIKCVFDLKDHNLMNGSLNLLMDQTF
jgi:hypothetical protein